MNKFFIITSVLMLINLIDANINNCPTHKSCVDIKNCPQINEIIKQGRNYEERLSIIFNNTCGLKSTNGTPQEIYVCCQIPLLPKLSECGKYCSNIFNQLQGETTAHISEFPWTVLLRKEDSTFENHICEGTLINQRYILTAAHCVSEINQLTQKNQSINIKSVRLGEWNKTSSNDCYNDICSDPPVDINIEKIIIHPEYQPESNHYNDIALLRLARNIKYTKYISPICLPLDENLRNHQFEDLSFYVSGWGHRITGKLSDIKLKSIVLTVEHTKCAREFYNKNGSTITKLQICTVSDNENSIKKCTGGSGGSLIGTNYENIYDPKHFLAGIESIETVSCGNNINDLPTVYTRVGQYIDWILKNLKP